MKTLLYLLTPSINTNLILKCKNSIKETLLNKDLNIKWLIGFDKTAIKSLSSDIIEGLDEPWIKYYFVDVGIQNHSAGAISNFLISKTEKSPLNWYWNLDDDNAPHPNMIDLYHNHVKEVSNINKALVWKCEDLPFIPGADTMKVSHVDQGQVLYPSLWKNRLHFVDVYVSDGILIETLYKETPDLFCFTDINASYYNHLKKSTSEILDISSPKLLVIANEDFFDIKGGSRADFESSNFRINWTNSLETKDLIKFNPDVIVTIGDKTNYENIPHLWNHWYSYSNKWISYNNINELNGDNIYYCANHGIMNNFEKNKGLFSIFTSAYKIGKKIWKTWEGVKNQIDYNWEWIIINDSDCDITRRELDLLSLEDERIKIYEFKNKTGGLIGEAKFRACGLCNGEYLLELDHDDYLLPNAIKMLREAFTAYPDAGFVYTDSSEVDIWDNCSNYGDYFALGYGSYYTESFRDKEYLVIRQPDINPLTIRHIVGVPNHIRCWTKEIYNKIGGYNRSLSIADDYEILVRTFLATRMVKIPRLAYLQYMYNDGNETNTQNKTRADIQRRVRNIAEHYNEAIKSRFEELGVEDWAYRKEWFDSVSLGKREGDENKVNYIYNFE